MVGEEFSGGLQIFRHRFRSCRLLAADGEVHSRGVQPHAVVHRDACLFLREAPQSAAVEQRDFVREGLFVDLSYSPDAALGDVAAADACEVWCEYGNVTLTPLAVSVGKPLLPSLVEEPDRLSLVDGHLHGPSGTSFHDAALKVTDGEDGLGVFHLAPVASQEIHVALRPAAQPAVGLQHTPTTFLKVVLGNFHVAIGCASPVPVVTRDNAVVSTLTIPFKISSDSSAGVVYTVVFHIFIHDLIFFSSYNNICRFFQIQHFDIY